MNIHLRDVICTSRVSLHLADRREQLLQQDGDRFWKIPECYVRGNTIKYLRLPEDVLALVKEDVNEKPTRSGPPTRRPFRGRGDGGRGGEFSSVNTHFSIVFDCSQDILVEVEDLAINVEEAEVVVVVIKDREEVVVVDKFVKDDSIFI